MAINQKQIAIDTCSKIVGSTNKLLDALDELEKISEQIVGANINLSDYENDISISHPIMHAASSTYKNILTAFAPSIKTGLLALYDGSPTQQGWAAFQAVRK